MIYIVLCKIKRNFLVKQTVIKLFIVETQNKLNNMEIHIL